MAQEPHSRGDVSSYVLDRYYRPKARAQGDSASVENKGKCNSLLEEIANLKMQLSECQHVVNIQKSALSTQKAVLDTRESELAQLRNEHEELINDMHDVYEIYQINEELRIDLEASRSREVSLALLCSKIARERDRITEELEDHREKNVNSRNHSIHRLTRNLKETAEERPAIETEMVDLMWQRHELSQKVEILGTEKNNSTIKKSMQEIVPVRPIPQDGSMIGGGSISEKILGKNNKISVQEQERPIKNEHGSESMIFHGGGGRPTMKRVVSSSSPHGYSNNQVETNCTVESRSSLPHKDANNDDQVNSNVLSSKFSCPIQSFFTSLANSPPSTRRVPLASSNIFKKAELHIPNAPSA